MKLSVLLTALLIRLFSAWYGVRAAKDTFNTLPYPDCCSDSFIYLTFARNLRFTKVFSMDQAAPFLSSAYRPPLYPLFLAALWSDGPPVVIAMFLQALLSTLTVYLVFVIAKEAFGARTAIVASALLAVAPLTVFYVGLLLTETLYTFLIVAGVYFWIKKLYWLAGLMFGLSLLTRPTTLPFLIVLTLFILWTKRKELWPILISALLVAAPWVARNYDVKGDVTIATGGTGVNLLLGTVPVGFKSSILDAYSQHRDVFTVESSLEDSEKIYRERAYARIKAEPLKWLWVRIGQWPRLFVDWGEFIHFREYHLPAYLQFVYAGINLLIVVLAGLGMWTNRKRFADLGFLYLFPLAVILGHVPLWTEPRYLLPAMPLLFIFAAQRRRQFLLERAVPCTGS